MLASCSTLANRLLRLAASGATRGLGGGGALSGAALGPPGGIMLGGGGGQKRGKRARMAVQPPGDPLAVVVQRLQSAAASLPATQPVSLKHAAVLVPLFAGADGEVRVVLTQRSSKLPTHQGEVCLPGGKRDPEDVDDVACALREANEELGIDPSKVKVLATLQPLLSKHMLSVTPVVAVVPAERTLHAPSPNVEEVEKVFDVPLATFVNSTGHSYRDLSWQGHKYRIHLFEVEDQPIVWGLTAGILIQVAKLAYDCEPSFVENTPKGGIEYTRFFFDGQQLRVHTLARPDQDDETIKSGAVSENQLENSQGAAQAAADSSVQAQATPSQQAHQESPPAQTQEASAEASAGASSSHEPLLVGAARAAAEPLPGAVAPTASAL